MLHKVLKQGFDSPRATLVSQTKGKPRSDIVARRGDAITPIKLAERNLQTSPQAANSESVALNVRSTL